MTPARKVSIRSTRSCAVVDSGSRLSFDKQAAAASGRLTCRRRSCAHARASEKKGDRHSFCGPNESAGGRLKARKRQKKKAAATTTYTAQVYDALGEKDDESAALNTKVTLPPQPAHLEGRETLLLSTEIREPEWRETRRPLLHLVNAPGFVPSTTKENHGAYKQCT